MPGLLRGIARVAAVSGTATAVSNRVSRRQANRWAQQGESEYYPPGRLAPPMGPQQPQQAAPPPPPAQPVASTVDQLKDLAELKQQGILTEEEFAAQKARILAG